VAGHTDLERPLARPSRSVQSHRNKAAQLSGLADHQEWNDLIRSVLFPFEHKCIRARLALRILKNLINEDSNLPPFSFLLSRRVIEAWQTVQQPKSFAF
jgi:hypothetical protein